MAIIENTVDPDGTGQYVSLQAWETARDDDIAAAGNIEKANCISSAGSDDTTLCTIVGWTTDSDSYVWIYGDEDHGGVWSPDNYLLNGGSGSAFLVRENFVHFENLQIRHDVAANGLYMNSAFQQTSPCRLRWDKCIVWLGHDATYYASGWYLNDAQIEAEFRNCVIYGDENTRAAAVGININNAATVDIHNCTISNVNNCINASAGVVGCINTLTHLEGAGGGFVDNGATLSVEFCSSDDGTADDHGGDGNNVDQTFSFIGAPDYHLASDDTGAMSLGTDLSAHATLPVTDDIDGDARDGSTPDIGFDEYVSAGPATLEINVSECLPVGESLR